MRICNKPKKTSFFDDDFYVSSNTESNYNCKIAKRSRARSLHRDTFCRREYVCENILYNLAIDDIVVTSPSPFRGNEDGKRNEHVRPRGLNKTSSANRWITTNRTDRITGLRFPVFAARYDKYVINNNNLSDTSRGPSGAPGVSPEWHRAYVQGVPSFCIFSRLCAVPSISLV